MDGQRPGSGWLSHLKWAAGIIAAGFLGRMFGFAGLAILGLAVIIYHVVKGYREAERS